MGLETVERLDNTICKGCGSAMFGPPGAEIFRTGPDVDQTTRPLGAAWILYGFIRAVRPKLVVEVGAGGSSAVIAYAIRHNGLGRLVTIDPKPGEPLHPSKVDENGKPLNIGIAMLLDMFEFFEFNDIVTYLQESSFDVGPRWNEPIDILVVDGDHRREAVSQDWDNFAKWIIPGGYAFFHDLIADAYGIGANLEARAERDGFTFMIEPEYLSLGIMQKKFTFNISKAHVTTFLAQATDAGDLGLVTPNHLTGARSIPGMLMPWIGRWFDVFSELEELDPNLPAEAIAKARVEADKIIEVEKRKRGL